MKSSILSFALIIASLFVLGGCQSAGEAEKSADQFHKHLKNRDYGKMMNMVSSDGLAISPAEDWEKLFRELERLGELKKVKKAIGFNTQIKNGITEVRLNYTLKYEKGEIAEELVLQKKGKDDFKLLGFNIRKK